MGTLQEDTGKDFHREIKMTSNFMKYLVFDYIVCMLIPVVLIYCLIYKDMYWYALATPLVTHILFRGTEFDELVGYYFIIGFLVCTPLLINIYVKPTDELTLTVIVGLLLLVLFYDYLIFKTTVYKVTNLFVQYEHGVLSRRVDTLDVTDIKDLRLDQSFWQRVFKLYYIQITSKDKSHPTLWLSNLDKRNAQEVYEYLNINATDSYVEYRRKKGGRKHLCTWCGKGVSPDAEFCGKRCEVQFKKSEEP